MGLNTLIISLDSTLAMDGNLVIGNTMSRQIEYAKHLSSLHIVTKTSKNVKRVINRTGNNLFIYPTSSLNRYTFIYDAYKIAAKVCRDNRIDIISTQDPFITGLIGWLLKERFGISLNIQIAGDMIDNQYFIKENILNSFFNWLAKRLIRRADTIRVANSRQKEALIKSGIEKNRIWRIPFFVDFGLFLQTNGGDIRRQYLSNKFDRLVLYAGRLAKEKALDTLIKAVSCVIKKYPKVLFLIIGRGPEEGRIKDLVLNLGAEDNVCFLGNVPYGRVPNFFSACDIFVNTSLYEGTPIVFLEAAASGKPIVSTSHTGARDTVEDDRTGYIVDFKKPKEMAEKLLYLLNNPEASREMGVRGREFVLSRFEKKGIIDSYTEMWRETAR